MAAATSTGVQRYQVGDLVIDTGSRQVMRGDEALQLGALTFDLFLCLVESAPDFVSYDRLADRVWQGRSVTNETITQRAKMLRDAISEDANAPRYLESIRGKGYRLIADVGVVSDERPTSTASRTALISTVAIIAIVAVAGAFLAGTRLFKRDVMPSVAVLPFADTTERGDQQYFTDGITEELINELAGLSGLQVASRTASFTFRDTKEDLRTIGEALGVANILEGSVRKFEGDIRVAVQLVEIESGFQLWSETFDREQEDIFAVQEEIATAVAGALGIRLGVGGVNDFRGAGTRNFAAYEAYLQGSYELATKLDPNYAAAWARLGVRTGSTMWLNPPEDAPAIIARALPYVKKAIELDPESVWSNGQFGTLIYAQMDWPSSEEAFAKSLSLRREQFNLSGYANMLMRAGRSRKAQTMHEESDAVERLPRRATSVRANVYIALEEFDEAREIAGKLEGRVLRRTDIVLALNDGSLEELRHAMEAVPTSEPAGAELYAPLLGILDSPDDAIAFLKNVLVDPGKIWPSKYHDIALLAAYFGDPEFALQAFSRELPYTTIRFGALWYPVMAEMRRLPGFKDVVTDVRLVEYWRTYGWSDFCQPLDDGDFVCR